MTIGDDIFNLITLRNLEIHLVIGLCCFEVCFWDRAFNWLAMVLIALTISISGSAQPWLSALKMQSTSS